MRDIDEVHHAKNHREADREHRVEAADHDPLDDRIHRFYPWRPK